MSARKRFSALALPLARFCGALASSAASTANVLYAETHALEIGNGVCKFQHFYADVTVTQLDAEARWKLWK